jgi:hypothetical protein
VNRRDPDFDPDLRDLLADSVAPSPLRPMWPYVQRRLRADRPVPSRRFTWSWAVGTGALATAGFAIGLLFGSAGTSLPNAEESFWGDLGSSFAEGSPFALDSFYERVEPEEGS